MKLFSGLVLAGVLTCSLVGGLIAQTTPEELADVAELIDDGATIIEEGSEGLTTVAELYGANNTDGETCTGPAIACAAGPSPDCDTGNCNAVTTITIPSCATNTSWIGTWHCYQNGMECMNGTCPDGFTCFNSVAGGCTSDWWWF